MSKIVILSLLLLLATSQATQANYIYGTIVDQDGNPLEGIPVSFLGVEGITDASGFYIAGDAAGVVPEMGITWGRVKAHFIEGEELSLPEVALQSAFEETTGVCTTNFRVLLDNGEVWQHNEYEGWVPTYASSGPIVLPVPVSQVKFVGNSNFFIDTNNDGWRHTGDDWVNIGYPGNGLSTQPTTWGQIKAEFGE